MGTDGSVLHGKGEALQAKTGVEITFFTVVFVLEKWYNDNRKSKE